MKRTLLPLPCSKSLVVPLRDVPALPPRKARRILPGLLNAQIPLDLSECVWAFARNGVGYVGLVARRADMEEALSGASADGAVPLPWAVWRQCHRELPPASENERRAVLFADGTVVTIATGRGAAFGAAAEVPAEADAVARTLRMAFGAEGGEVRCLCAGKDAETWARTLRERGVSVNVGVVNAPKDFRSRALMGAVKDRADGGVFDTAASLAKRERGRCLCRLAVGVLLLGAAVALFRQSGMISSEASRAGRELDRELSVRVDALVGYPVTVRGDRAVALAKESAAKRNAETLAQMLRPGASDFLAKALGALAETEKTTLFLLRADADGIAVSGNAPDEAAVRAFASALEKAGLECQVEIPKESAGPELVRFVVTAKRRKP